MDKRVLSIPLIAVSMLFMQSCSSWFNSNPYELLVAGYQDKWIPIQDALDQKEQTVLIAPDGRVVFESRQWMNNADSTVLFHTFQDRYLLAIPCPRYILLFAQRSDYDYRDIDFPRNIMYVIDVADDRVLYRTNLEYAVLVDISNGYAWGRDPETGELRSRVLEVVHPRP